LQGKQGSRARIKRQSHAERLLARRSLRSLESFSDLSRRHFLPCHRFQGVDVLRGPRTSFDFLRHVQTSMVEEALIAQALLKASDEIQLLAIADALLFPI